MLFDRVLCTIAVAFANIVCETFPAQAKYLPND